MPPRKRIPRLEDFALEALAGYVGRSVVTLVRERRPDVLARGLELLKDELSVNVPVSLYDDFAVKILSTISRDANNYEIREIVDQSNSTSGVLAIIDKLTSVEKHPAVATELTVILWTNLHELKTLKKLVVDQDETLLRICLERDLESRGVLERTSWLKRCDLRHLTKLECPAWFFDEETFLVPGNYSKLEIVTVFDPYSRRGTTVKVLTCLARLTGLREVDLHRCGYMSSSEVSPRDVEALLANNRKIRKLALSCNLEALLGSEFTYEGPEHVHICCRNAMSDDLKSLPTRFPNLRSLTLHPTRGFDPIALLAFPRLSSLSVLTSNYALEDLWSVLEKIGNDIISLEFSFGKPLSVDDVAFIREHCGRIEHLAFYWRNDVPSRVTLPRFSTLKHLRMSIMDYSRGAMLVNRPKIDLVFDEMPSLESLKYPEFEITSSQLQSIVEDSRNFPRLTEIIVPFGSSETLESIRRIARESNSDVNVTPSYL